MPTARLYATMSDVTTAGVICVGGTTLHGCTDDPYDAINDLDRAQWPDASSIFELSLFAPIPSILTVTSVKLAARHKNTATSGGTFWIAYRYMLPGYSPSTRISGYLTYGAGWLNASETLTLNPFTSAPWTEDELRALKVQVEGVCTTYDVGECSSVYLEVPYTEGAPEDRVERASRELRLLRRQIRPVEIQTPLWTADVPLLGEVGLAHTDGPTPSGPGWARDTWARRRLVVIGREIDFDSLTINARLLDMRDVTVADWDTGVSEEPPDTGDGVARLSMGGRHVVRGTASTVENAATEAQGTRQVSSIPIDLEHFDRRGVGVFDAATNWQIQSSFKNGSGTTFTGWTAAGVGSNGSAINEETADLLFGTTTLTARCPRFVAGNPIHVSDLQLTGTASAVFPANSVVTVSIDHKDFSGAALQYVVQRSADSYYYRASDQTWQAAKTWNPMTISATAHRHVVLIALGTGFNTLTVIVGIPTTGTAAQQNLCWHVQVEEGYAPTPRIVTETAIVSRAADQLRMENFHGQRTWPAQGSCYLEFTPAFTSTDLPSSGHASERTLLCAYYDASNYDRLFYDAANDAVLFRRRRAAANYDATIAKATTRDTAVTLAARWTGGAGELSLAPYTLSLWVDGTKAPDAAAGGIQGPLPSGPYLRIGHEAIDEPSAISGLKLWVEADTITGVADGVEFSPWSDLSGSANHLTAAGGLRPTYETNEINGLPVVRFNGSADYFAIPNMSLTTAHWFFLVRMAVVNTGTAQVIMGSATADYVGELCEHLGYLRFWSGAAWEILGTASAATWYLIEMTRDGSYGIGAQDGVYSARFALGGGYSKAQTLGARNGTYYASCDIAVGLAYDRILRMDEARLILRRICAKYNLSMLGSRHATVGRTATGFIRHRVITPVCLTDEEIGDMP